MRQNLHVSPRGVDQGDGKRWSRLPEGMTYERWKAGKPAVTGAKPANRTISEFMDMSGTKRKLDVAGVPKTEACKRLLRPVRRPLSTAGAFSRRSRASILQTPAWPK